MKIMLADDEESIATLIGRIMLKEGYEFCHASDGEEALEMFDREHPDLLLLDVMMPAMNGFDVCMRLRKNGATQPIMFLTAKGDIVDKSVGFRVGGDDYLVKPFLPEELVLRIEALLRRATSAPAAASPELVRYDGVEIDMRRRRVCVEGRSVDLTPKEFNILALLAARPGEVFTREQLAEEVWGADYLGDSSGITVFIRKIREKIEKDPSAPRYVQTVWRVGYRFGD